MPRKSKKRNAGPLHHSRRGHRRLTDEDKALVVQTYFAVGSKGGTCKKLGITYKLCCDVLAEAEQNPSLMAARGRAYDAVGGKITGVVSDIIDSIKPEHLETEIHEIHDDEGNLRRVIVTGPSLRDKAFAAGILTDKIAIMQKARHDAHTSRDGHDQIQLMLPDDVEGAKDRVTQLIKNLNFINVTVRDDGVAQRVEQLRKKAFVTHEDIEEAELVDLSSPDPFD